MSSNIRRKNLQSDSDDSTEDLIIKDEPPISPHGMLSTEPYLNYVVEVPNDTSKSRCKLVNKTLLLVVILLLLICTIFVYLYFHERHLARKKSNGKYCTSKGCVESAAFIQSSLEETVNPCQDFYKFACGGWLRKNPIPDNKERWSIDSVLRDKNMLIQRDILQNDSIEGNMLDSEAEFEAFKLYRSCMDMKTINKLNVQPLNNLLKQSGGIVKGVDKNADKKKNINKLLKDIYSVGTMTSFFDVSVGIDDKHSSMNILKFSQAGLSLSMFRYKNETDTVVKVYMNYLTVLVSKLDLGLSEDAAAKIVDDVFKFQRKLYKIHVPREERATIDQTYYRTTLANLSSMVPMIEWTDYVNFLIPGLPKKIEAMEPILIPTLKYFQKLQGVLEETSFKVIQNHAILNMAAAYANLLTNDIILLQKNFSIAQYGVYEERPRWKRCVSSVDKGLGMALGAMFVRKAFAQDSYKEANDMVERLRSAFEETLPHLEWMDKKTQEAAKEKAEKIVQKIGYPPYILKSKELDKHYEGLNMNESEYFKNFVQLTKYFTKKSFFELRKKADRQKWYMSPPTINAYYSPNNNQIVFPAGILQPPYFKANYPRVVNYGGMGSVIGHEITHGFDNNGRLYDKDGNYHGREESWWSQYSIDGFNKRKTCFADQYYQFIVAEKHIKGNLTLGENIADNGGLKASLKAYKDWVQENGEELLLPGLAKTNDQVFFISFAQSWCSGILKGVLLKQIEVDPHSPEMQRVLGSVQNEPDFAKAFNCPVGSKMNPSKKCSIW